MRIFILHFIALLFSTVTFSQNHITLVYKGKKAKIKNAVDKANEILNSYAFYEEIRKIDSFANSSLSGHYVASLMENSKQVIVVVGAFRPIANASTTSSDKIKVSIFHFSSNLSIGVNTLIHETVHAVDFLDGEGIDFTHSDNNNDDHKQDKTAPWIIGEIAEKMVKSL